MENAVIQTSFATHGEAWDEHTLLQGGIRDINIARLQATLTEMGVVEMDLTYSHDAHRTPDGGSGTSYPVTMTLENGTELSVAPRWAPAAGVQDPVAHFRERMVQVDRAWPMADADDKQRWIIQKDTVSAGLLDALADVSLIDGAFMVQHGVRSLDFEPNDEGGSIEVIRIEGKARMSLADMKPHPLDANGNVPEVKGLREAGSGRFR